MPIRWAVAVAASAALWPIAASARSVGTEIAACEALATDEEAFKGRAAPIALPAEWRGLAQSSLDWLAVRTGAGGTHCVDMAWIDDAEGFEIFADRFLGFEWQAYEAWGYVLVDTAGAGGDMDTGTRPVFSPDGQRFATIQWSDAGWGGFEGFAVWEVQRAGFAPLHVDTALAALQDWRIDRWEGEDCLHLSAVPYERIGGDWERLATAERDRYVAGAASGWRLTPGETCPAYDAG